MSKRAMQSFLLIMVLSLAAGFVVCWGMAGVSGEARAQVVSGDRP